MLSEDFELPAMKSVEFNSSECAKAWTKKFTEGRKTLSVKSCGKKKRSFQLDSETCLQIKFVRQSENGKKWLEAKVDNSNIHLELKAGKNKEELIKIKSTTGEIPNSSFALWPEGFEVELYADSDPNQVLIRLSGPTMGYDGGTGRGVAGLDDVEVV